MRELFLFLFFISISISSLTAQVKKTFEDNKDRTVVVKEEGVDDYDILEAQFGDVPVGKVIKITMDKPPREKTVKPVKKPTPKPKVKKPSPPKKKKKAPPKVKKPPKPPVPAIRGYDTRAPYPLKRTKLKRHRLKKKKRPKKGKRGKCFEF